MSTSPLLPILGALTVVLGGRAVLQVLTYFCAAPALSDNRHLRGQHLWSTLGFFFKTLLEVLLIINIFPEVVIVWVTLAGVFDCPV